VNYISEVHDPCFRADKVDNSDDIPTWSSSTIYSFLGYVERWQVCIDGSCSTPSGILTLASDDLNVPLASRNPMQDAVLRLILEAMDSSSIANVVQYLNQDILLAKSFICKLHTKSIQALQLSFQPRFWLFSSSSAHSMANRSIQPLQHLSSSTTEPNNRLRITSRRRSVPGRQLFVQYTSALG
jgi:hypothetical protein